MTATSSQPVSGRYRGRDEHTEVELRIDADGPRPTMRVSADYYRDGAYHGSMRIDAAKISFAPDAMSIGGRGTFTWSTRHTTVGVRIPRVPAGGACAPATLSHFTSNGGAGAVYACAFESTSFRRVDLEEAVQRGVEPLRAYDTGALPSGGPLRTLSPVGAFAEAGVELVRIDPPADVDTSSAGPDATWNDAELYAAMQRSFTRLGDAPRWAVWTLHATAHDNPQLFGLMFDRRGPQRQGCAVFYGSIPPATAADRGRHELRTCVHELGHTFNLPHCWQASPAAPSLPSRPDAATWMNYPSNFPGGEPAYWRSFAFRFDDPELVFLRHGFRQSVIMGGVPFLGGAADEGPVTASRPRASRTLRLQLDAPATIALGMPVTVGFLLHARATAGQSVPTALGPRAGTVDVSVAPPAGPAFVFGPLLSHCRGDETVSLTAGDEPLRDAAFIHYGRNGFMFARAGLYRVRARHITLDGSVLLSNVATIRVLAPATPADRAVAELALGDEDVGTLMSLMGSRAPQLQRANDGLDAIIRGFPEHPFADVARVVRAAGLARDDRRRAGAAAARAAQAILRQDVALEARTAEAELPAALDASNAAPLAGRDDELAWLRARWERARGGAGGLVTLSGPRGVGKRRLVAERGRAEPRPRAREPVGAARGRARLLPRCKPAARGRPEAVLHALHHPPRQQAARSDRQRRTRR